MPDDTPVTIAKEITLAMLPRYTGMGQPENIGDQAGRMFKAVLKHVKEAVPEK